MQWKNSLKLLSACLKLTLFITFPRKRAFLGRRLAVASNVSDKGDMVLQSITCTLIVDLVVLS